jgi:hypothetical protein
MESSALYGCQENGAGVVKKVLFGVAQLTSTTVSETDGDGRIENVANIRSGYSCMAEVIN